MSKRVNNSKGKRFARRHARHNRIATEQIHAFRVRKIAEDPGYFLRTLGVTAAAIAMKQGSRDMTSAWNPPAHTKLERRSNEAVLQWRAAGGDRQAKRVLAMRELAG